MSAALRAAVAPPGATLPQWNLPQVEAPTGGSTLGAETLPSVVSNLPCTAHRPWERGCAPRSCGA